MTSDTRALLACAALWSAAFLCPGFMPLRVTLPNELLMTLGWGIALSGAALRAARMRTSTPVRCIVALGIGLIALAVLSQTPQSAALLTLSLSVFLFGTTPQARVWAPALMWALLVSGLLNVPMAGWQVLDPQSIPLDLPRSTKAVGRAVGFMGQPNSLATLQMWALAALIGLTALRGWRFALPAAAAIMLGASLAWTGSRTGLLELGIIALWVWRANQLPSHARRLAAFASGGYLLGLLLSWTAAHFGHAPMYAELRAHSGGDISSSRFMIWRDSLGMLQENWLTGVGWGSFNFAWSLTEVPQRHPALFTHAHNLPLHLAVEIGLPLATSVLAVLAWSLWRARGGMRQACIESALICQIACVMLAIIGMHSLLEYPLWYAHLLLPTAFWLGVYMAAGERQVGSHTAHSAEEPRSRAAMLVRTVGVVAVFGSFYVASDFYQVAQVFKPFGARRLVPLEQRIADARQSTLFGAMGDYAAVVEARDPTKLASTTIERPLHWLVDSRVLIGYATALAARGDLDRARYVAQRVREFNHPVAAKFLAECERDLKPRPFQCDAPAKAMKFSDFIPAFPPE